MKSLLLLLTIAAFTILVLNPADAQTTRTVLIEEFTGTWCGYCPYGADILRDIIKNNSYARAVSYHQGLSDTMTTPEGNQVIAKMNPAYPQAAIDRVLWPGESKLPISRSKWATRTAERSAVTSPMSITVSGEFDQYTRVMTANIHLEALAPMSGTYNLNVIVTEDGINQRQTYYPPGGGTVYLEPYYHEHVVRKMITGAFGKQLTSSGLPASWQRDTTVTYTLPSWWAYTKLHLTVMVAEMGSGNNFAPIAQSFQETMMSIFQTVPVRLITFLAEQSDEGVRLSWRTASESNNLGWEIERRDGGGAWSKIGFVEGRGTTNQQMTYEFTDRTTRFETAYEYRLKQIDVDGTSEYSPVARVCTFAIPTGYLVEQNYPNPFNPATVIRYSMPFEEHLTIRIYDNLGRHVRTLIDDVQQAGPWEVTWDGTTDSGVPVANGTYHYTVETPRFSTTKHMTLVR